MTEHAVAVQTHNAPVIHASPLQPHTFNEVMQFGKIAAASGMVPRDYAGKPEAVVIAVQMGAELGLSPMQAIQNIAVINGRPSVWGDALLALVRASHVCQDVQERVEGEGDRMIAICVAIRKGSQSVEARFSVADAVAAGLWNKPGPWKSYPKRMLQMRARGFALRDAFPDVLRGLISGEEAQDIPPEPVVVEAHPVDPEPQPSPEEKAHASDRSWADKVMARFEEMTTVNELEDATANSAYQNRLTLINERHPDIATEIENCVHRVTGRLFGCDEDGVEMPE